MDTVSFESGLDVPIPTLPETAETRLLPEIFQSPSLPVAMVPGAHWAPSYCST